jgi:hypothetical protein
MGTCKGEADIAACAASSESKIAIVGFSFWGAEFVGSYCRQFVSQRVTHSFKSHNIGH